MKKLIVAIFIIALIFNISTSKLSAAVISPDKFYIDINPNQELNFELKVIADALQPNPIDLYIYPMGMTKLGEEDDRDFFIPNLNDQAEPANWITLKIDKINLSAGQIISIPFSLKPSAISRCGTNLASIFISSSPRSELSSQSNTEAEGSQVGIKSSIVSQLHINVSEKTKEYCNEVATRLELIDFKVDSTFPIFNYHNIPFVTRIKNTGNLLSQNPKGYIELFGIGPKITIPFNQEGLDIYPETTRKFSNTWIDENYPTSGNFFEELFYEISHFRFGQYEARLGVTFNVSPKIISTVNVWIIPWRIITILLIIVSIAVIFFIRDRKRSKELKKLKKNISKK